MKAKDFNWETCPFCGCDFSSRFEVLGVMKSDDLELKEIKMHCNSCGATYSVERKVSWKARLIEKGKPLHQEVAEFLDDRQKHLEEHFKAR